jgi:guanine deaminase
MYMKGTPLRFMRRAIKLSLDNVTKHGGGPFGAVIVKDGKIVAEGANRVTATNDPTAHAEIEAIREACRKLKTFSLQGAQIYTSCEPCPMCLAAIYWSKLDVVYFANSKADAARIQFDDHFIYKEIPKSPSKRKIPMRQLMRTEALKVFAIWDEKTDKTPY